MLRGLRAIDYDMTENWVRRGRDWLASCQNEDGGWGERCNTYDDPLLKGKGPSTASQTAWALMGLVRVRRPGFDRACSSGLQYLLDTQNADGSWTEDEITGTGFPKVFYLKYDMYRNNFPLLALATYENARAGIFRPNHIQSKVAARNGYYPKLKKFVPQFATALAGLYKAAEGPGLNN